MRHAQEANAAAKARVSTLRLGAQTPSEVLRQFDTLEKAIVEATQARGRARALVNQDLQDTAAGRKRKRKRRAERTAGNGNGGDGDLPDALPLAVAVPIVRDGDADGDGKGSSAGTTRAKRQRH